MILLIAGSGEQGLVASGSVLHAFTTPPQFDEAPLSLIELRMRGTLLVGMVVFGLAIILTSFR